MKSSVAFAGLLCAPQIYAVALPHHKDELYRNGVAHARRGGPPPDHGHELNPRYTPPAGGIYNPPTTPVGRLPEQTPTDDNPYVGNHPFIGHGPVVPFPTAGPTTTSYPSENYTLTYLATGTTPPIANGTATIYLPPVHYPVINATDATNATDLETVMLETISCDYPDQYDADGKLLPKNLQPKSNGTSICTPANLTFIEAPPQAERIEVEGHMRGDHQIVEVEITTLPLNSTSWNGTSFNETSPLESTPLDDILYGDEYDDDDTLWDELLYQSDDAEDYADLDAYPTETPPPTTVSRGNETATTTDSPVLEGPGVGGPVEGNLMGGDELADLKLDEM